MLHAFLAAAAADVQLAVQATPGGFVVLASGGRESPDSPSARDARIGGITTEEHQSAGADFASRRIEERRTVYVFRDRLNGQAVEPLAIHRGDGVLLAGDDVPWTIDRVSGDTRVTCELSRSHKVDHQRADLTRRLKD